MKPFIGLEKCTFTDLLECLQIHSMTGWLRLEGTSGQSHISLLLMQGHVQLIAQEHVQTAFEYI